MENEKYPGRKSPDDQISSGSTGTAAGRANPNGPSKRTRARIRWVVFAACLCLTAVGIYAVFRFINFTPSDGKTMCGGDVHKSGEDFDFYSGPIMPLAAEGDTERLAADREITVTLTGSGGSPDGAGPTLYKAAVTDAYTIENPSASDADLTLIYPFVSRLSSDEGPEEVPRISLDGTILDTKIRIGGYSGGFTDDRMNLAEAPDWEAYRNLLADGSYLGDALSDRTLSDEPVTVYYLEHASVREDGTDAQTIGMIFQLDEAKSKVVTYGINGSSYDGSSFCFSYFAHDYGEAAKRCLIVVGDPISSWEIKGYTDGSCTEEQEGLTCDVRTEQTTLGDIFRVCAEDFLRLRLAADAKAFSPSYCTPDNLSRAAYTFYVSYASGSDAMERYDMGSRLDDILQDAYGVRRVMYAVSHLTIPAGQSLSIRVEFSKSGSHDIPSENAAFVFGYDMAAIGSNIAFRKQTANVILPEDAEITAQNFGFDPAAGITGVDLPEEHCYMEISEKD